MGRSKNRTKCSAVPKSKNLKGTLKVVYPSLCNELAHERGVVLEATKLDVPERLARLHTIIQQAIS